MEATAKEPPKEPEKKVAIVKHVTQSGDKLNEPPPQPRVRKVTTVTSTLAIVVSRTEDEIGVWVLTTCDKKMIPMREAHMFVNLNVGIWMAVGIYPDGSLASFSPYSYYLEAYPTAVLHNTAYVERNAAEFRFRQTVTFKEMCEEMNIPVSPEFAYCTESINLYKINGFGLVLAHPTLDTWIDQNLKNGTDGKVWIQWCGDVSRKYCWTVNSFIHKPTESELPDKQLREFAEFIRNRKIHVAIPEPTEDVVSRHFGLITDVNVDKKIISCWSPHVSMDVDHVAHIPQPPKHHEVDSPMLPPLVGQWVQFDLDFKDTEKYMSSETGTRLSIPEYLPITSPAGVAVAHVNRIVRLMISRILVKGTDNPYLFELPHFGFVIDRRASLISGTHMQLVLEKTVARVRKLSGVCWTVQSALDVHPNDCKVEQLQDLSVLYVPVRDSMEVSHSTILEKPAVSATPKVSPTSTTSSNSTASNNGVTTLKYQQPPQYQTFPSQEFFGGSNVHMGNGHMINERGPNGSQQKRKTAVYTGATAEGHALVEKIQTGNNSVILWMLDTHSSYHTYFTEKFPFSAGDYAYVKVVQKPDNHMMCGYRWHWVSGTKKTAPFPVSLSKLTGSILVQDTIEYQNHDRSNRAVFSSNLFGPVVDFNGCVSNPKTSKPMLATITRKKISHHFQDKMFFQWIIHNTSQFSHPHAPYYRSTTVRHLPLQSAGPMTDTGRTPPPSDRSSTSPPLLNGVTTSSDE